MDMLNKLVPALVSGGPSMKTHQANGAAHSFTKPCCFFLNTLCLAMCSVIWFLTVDFYHLLKSLSHPLFGSSSSQLTPLLFAMTVYAPQAADQWVDTWTPTQFSSECHLVTGTCQYLTNHGAQHFSGFQVPGIDADGTCKICSCSVSSHTPSSWNWRRPISQCDCALCFSTDT